MAGTAGAYNDGQTAARRPVTVLHDVNGLRLVGEAGGVIDLWRYDRLRLIDEPRPGRPLRLGLAGSDARLTLEDHGVLADLSARAPQLRQKARGRLGAVLRVAAMTVAAVAVLAAVLWFVLPRGAAVATRFVPVPWEVALGDQVMDQVIGMFADSEGEAPRFCDAAAGRAALDRLTSVLARAAGSPYELRVAVLDHEVVNAFALPGGQMIIFRGLIDFAGTPEELAAVLGHEIGHVVRRHTTQLILRNLGVAFFFGVMLGDLGSGTIAAAGETFLALSYGREAEAEADATAIDLLRAVGVRPDGLASFFRRLSAEAPELPKALALLSTHPTNAARAAAAAQAGDGGGPALSAEDWTALKRICRG